MDAAFRLMCPQKATMTGAPLNLQGNQVDKFINDERPPHQI